MVALDDETKSPKQIPPVILDNEEQKEEWEAAVLRAEFRKNAEKKAFNSYMVYYPKGINFNSWYLFYAYHLIRSHIYKICRAGGVE